MRELVEGRSVAVVGRGGSLNASRAGPRIDQADVVLRVNWQLPIAGATARDVGTRTDVLYHCVTVCRVARDQARDLGIPTVKVDTRLRKELAFVAGQDPADYRPNTGTVAIYHVLRDGAARVTLFGFDFGDRGYTAGQGEHRVPREFRGPAWSHDAEVDREMIARLVRISPRVSVDPSVEPYLDLVPEA